MDDGCSSLVLTVALHTWTTEPERFCVKEHTVPPKGRFTKPLVLSVVAAVYALYMHEVRSQCLKVIRFLLQLIRGSRHLSPGLPARKENGLKWFYGLPTELQHTHHPQRGHNLHVAGLHLLWFLTFLLRKYCNPSTPMFMRPTVTHHRT